MKKFLTPIQGEPVMTLFPTPDNTLCLVVDIQERLMPVMHGGAHMIAQTRMLLSGLQALAVPVLITEQYPKGLGQTLAEIRELAQHAPVFEKTRFSACTSEVNATLDARGAHHVIVVGAESHVCVLQTALELHQQGRRVHLPADCVASRHLTHKKNAVRQMSEAGIVITNTESLLFQLLGDAKHPAFKTISNLVR